MKGNLIEINSFLDSDEHTSDGGFTIYNRFDDKMNEANFSIESVGAKNFYNDFFIVKKKDGERTQETITMLISEGETNEIIITF